MVMIIGTLVVHIPLYYEQVVVILPTSKVSEIKLRLTLSIF
jgi:hypothetical protein